MYMKMPLLHQEIMNNWRSVAVLVHCMGLECFSSFWNNLNSFCKPHHASVVGANSCPTPS